MSIRRGYGRDELIDLVAGPGDIRDEEWYQLLLDIADWRASGNYRWADDTLMWLAAAVDRTHTVTLEQRAILSRIINTEWLPSRAYDPLGFGRRWR